MSASQPEAMIQQYLDRVASELRDLPPEERSEILTDLRAHINEAIGDPATASETQVRNVLDRLGDPVEYARESRARPEESPPETRQVVYWRVNKSPGALEIAAIVLTALFWPVGLLLAWLSPRWLGRDKLVATLVPIASFFLLVSFVFGIGAAGPHVPFVTHMIYPGPDFPTHMIGWEVRSMLSEFVSFWPPIGRLFYLMLMFVGSFGGPFLSAFYLAIRLQPQEERVYPDEARVNGGIPAGAS